MTDSQHRVEVFRDAGGEYRWHKVATRGNLPDEIVSTSGEGYTSQIGATEAARRENPGAEIVQR